MNKTTTAKKTAAMTNPLIAGMRIEGNVAVTANGAKSNASSLDSCVDLFASGAAMRKRSDADVVSLFEKAFYQDRLTALKVLFYIRDVREGQGERKTFRTALRWLADNYTDILVKNIDNVAFFGRWDDLYCLVGTKAENAAFKAFSDQLDSDIKNSVAEKPISLLAKWLKSINTSSAESKRLGYMTAKALNLSPKAYRKILSRLRKEIDVLETKISAGKWSEIDYEKIPSKASLMYRKAFGKRDGERYRSYLAAVEKGEAKMNASVVYPYEIVRPIENGEHDATSLKTLDLSWKNMPNWLEGNPHKGIVLADTSGSMNGLPILVSVSLAIYFAERNVGPYKDTFITFSVQPKLQKIIGQTIAEKVRGLDRGGWDGNTNIQAAFDLILNTAIKYKVSEADMPDVLYIVSDMQFDMATGQGGWYGANTKTNYEVIKTKYENAGYKMPKLVFWNVNASNSDQPVTINDDGVCLVSGCSPSILKSVLSAKTFTPVDVMFETINKPRYDVVSV
jgi:hypothetical protein